MTLLDLITQEKKDFEHQIVQVVEGFDFNQKSTLERIYRYYNSKFEGGEVDTEGNKKYFFNIVRNPCKVTTKAIDFDTKDIRILTAAGSDPLKTWYFERDLRFWMKDQDFGKVLNRIFTELPILGSVVLKIIDGVPHFVDLRNFIVEQSADTLGKAEYIIEKHLFTPMEFRKVGTKMGWENIDKAIEEWRRMDEPYLTVYERYGEVKDEEDNFTYRRFFVADVGTEDVDRFGKVTPYQGIELASEEVTKHPYHEFHLEKIPGRWLGVGIIETLFDAQVRMNELANQLSKGTYWAAAHIFQSADESVNRNLKHDVKDGEIITADSEITQVNMGNRNLDFFNQESMRWMKNIDDLTFRYEVIRGERLPAGTPLGAARIAAFMNGAYFDHIRETIALDMKKLIYDVIIPRFQRENTREHTLRLVGVDLDKIRELLIGEKAYNDLFRFIEKKRQLPSNRFLDGLKSIVGEKIGQKKEILLKIPKDFYKNLKYKIDIVITGEQKDTAVMAQTYFAALQAITADPTLLTDPSKKKFFYKWLEQGGISPIDLEPEQPLPSVEQLVQQLPVKGAGGGVSRPAAPAQSGTPVPGERTL
jgi:hypothetical protein